MFDFDSDTRAKIGNNAFFIGVAAAGAVILFGVFQGAPVTSPLLIGGCIAGLMAVFIAEYIACNNDPDPVACVLGKAAGEAGGALGKGTVSAGGGLLGGIFSGIGSLFGKK